MSCPIRCVFCLSGVRRLHYSGRSKLRQSRLHDTVITHNTILCGWEFARLRRQPGVTRQTHLGNLPGDRNPIHFHGKKKKKKSFSDTICQRDYVEPGNAARRTNCDNYIFVSLAGKLSAYESCILAVVDPMQCQWLIHEFSRTEDRTENERRAKESKEEWWPL